MTDLADWLLQLKSRFSELVTGAPASRVVLDDLRRSVGEVPEALVELLRFSNGLEYRSFHLFPALDKADPKRTWDSIQRANEPNRTSALGGNPSLLARFLVFADIGGAFAAIDRRDGTVWFEEPSQGELSQTDLSFREFVETMLRNAS
jgi:hypothetical protein